MAYFSQTYVRVAYLHMRLGDMLTSLCFAALKLSIPFPAPYSFHFCVTLFMYELNIEIAVTPPMIIAIRYYRFVR